MKPIQDKAEVSIDFPDKFYVGSFSRDSKFEARTEDDGLLVKLEKPGEEKRAVAIHLHHHLLADILSAWADSLAAAPITDGEHRKTLRDALKKLQKAVSGR
jgi:hypothetical protein